MEFFPKFIHSFNPTEPGYLFMWTLLFAGVTSIAITVERAIFLAGRSGAGTEKFMKEVLDRIRGDDISGAQKLCADAGNIAMARIVGSVLQAVSTGERRTRNIVDESILSVVPQLEKRTGYLATISNVATLIGLMGTIYGLILSFAAVGKPGIDAVEKSTLLASGIATAMNTTFMGLMVAVPAIVSYALLKSKTQRIIDEIDEHSLRFANALAEKSGKTLRYDIKASQMKDSVSVHVKGNRVQLYVDDRLVREIST